jgi:GH25 family lysozyme M1 (1,4-beta-N-acetylmuramidase)
MKLSAISLAASLGLASGSPAKLQSRSTVPGFDISSYQGTVDFAGAYSSGARFVIIKVRLHS